MTLAEISAKAWAHHPRPLPEPGRDVWEQRFVELLVALRDDPEFAQGPKAIAELKGLRERLQKEIQREEQKCTEHHPRHPPGFRGVCEVPLPGRAAPRGAGGEVTLAEVAEFLDRRMRSVLSVEP